MKPYPCVRYDADDPPTCAHEPGLWRSGAYPGSGEVCDEPASPGSDFCPAHDPDLL